MRDGCRVTGAKQLRGRKSGGKSARRPAVAHAWGGCPVLSSQARAGTVQTASGLMAYLMRACSRRQRLSVRRSKITDSLEMILLTTLKQQHGTIVCTGIQHRCTKFTTPPKSSVYCSSDIRELPQRRRQHLAQHMFLSFVYISTEQTKKTGGEEGRDRGPVDRPVLDGHGRGSSVGAGVPGDGEARPRPRLFCSDFFALSPCLSRVATKYVGR